MDPISLLIYAALFVLMDLLRPKPSTQNAKPAGLGDFSFPTATEGRVVPLIWGTVQVTGPNVIWYGDLRQVAITQHVKTGLFSSEDIVVGYKYYVGLQFGMCRGTVDALLRVWIDDTQVFSGTVTDGGTVSINQPALFGGDTLGQGGVVGTLRFFAGTETQPVSTYLSTLPVVSLTLSATPTGLAYSVGDVLTVLGGTTTHPATILVTSVNGGGGILSAVLQDPGAYTVVPSNPVSVTGGAGTGASFNLAYSTALQDFPGGIPLAYRGTSFCLFEDGYVGNSTSIKPWKFEVRRIPTGPATGSFQSVNGGLDANPVNVIYEVLTNSDWGMGFDPSTIDTANFQAAGVILHDEGNGWSFILDRAMDAQELINEIQNQIAGIVFQNQVTGLWQVSLARGGYDPSSLRELNASCVTEYSSFSRATWVDTTNQVRVQFVDRADSYKTTFAPAQDMANIRLQAGVNVSVDQNYYGIKNRTLANAVAWRDLRSLSYPIAKAQVVVDRSFWATIPGTLFAYTNVDENVTRMPMRVARVDFAGAPDNKITLDLVQDVYYSSTGSFNDPPPSGWTPPSDALQPFTLQQAFEAPRGFTVRALGQPADRIWVGAHHRKNEVAYAIIQRNALGSPSGAFTSAGSSFQFLLIGRLKNVLAAGTAYPTTSVLVTPNVDDQATLIAGFGAVGSTSDLGLNLVNLVLIDGEMILVTGASVSVSDVSLDGAYRGALDTAQAGHKAGANVWVLSAGGTLATVDFPPGNTVEVKLLPETSLAILPDTSATAVSNTMANRWRRPYVPSSVSLSGTAFAATTSLEGTGSGPDDYGIGALLNRRDFRTTDEVQALTVDAATLFADYPAANSTTHTIAVRNDPLGANTLLFTLTLAGQSMTVLRTHVLRFTNGVLPATMRVDVAAHHVLGGTSYDSWEDLVWDFAVTTALTGQFNFGARAASTVSNLYMATQPGTYNFVLSSAFTVGNVQYRKNGGAFATLISAGTTTGSIAGIVATDTIEVQHMSTDAGAEKFLAMSVPGGGQNAYFIAFV